MPRTFSRIAFPLALTLMASGCGWYMDMSNSIGSHMPTYDGWFGDGEKKPEKPVEPTANNPYGVDPYPYGSQAPVPPRGQAMPQNYYPTERYGVPAPQQQVPPMYMQQPPQGSPQYYAPPAMNAPAPGGVAPDQGLRDMQMQQQMMMQGAPAPAPYFTQPDLVAPPEPAPSDDESSLKPGQLPSELPLQTAAAAPKEEGTFAFFDDISETVAGWFGDGEDKQPYPSLATVPPAPDYKSRQLEVASTEKELVTDRDNALAQQKQVDDWGDLVESAPSAGSSDTASGMAAAPVIAPAFAPIAEPVAAPAELPLQAAAPAILPEHAAAIPSGQQIVYPKLLPSLAAAPAALPAEPEYRPVAKAEPKKEEGEWYTAFERNLGLSDDKAEVAAVVAPVPAPQETAYVPAPAPSASAPAYVPAPAPVASAAAPYAPVNIVPAVAAAAAPEALRAPEISAPQGFLPTSRYAARRAADRFAAAQ